MPQCPSQIIEAAIGNSCSVHKRAGLPALWPATIALRIDPGEGPGWCGIDDEATLASSVDGQG